VTGHSARLLFVCHGESSTGVLQPLDGIGAMCRAHDCLFLVDTVASLAAAPFAMDALQVDIVYSASQKALSAPTGMAPISFNTRAW
jgi:alanine-glyoxylate transaminase/serine-glyoxylate transaminase/serine-pyruvate transaminase